MAFRKSSLLLVLCLLPLGSASAQEAQRGVTNSDIVNMTKSGVAEQTIVLMIQKSVPKFDLSADAVIELKKAGVSDAVLNAMLSTPADNVISAGGAQQDCAQSLDRVVAALGDREKLLAIRSLRWSGKEVVERASGRTSLSSERVTALSPNLAVYYLRTPTAGPVTKLVFTPEFSYTTSGKLTTTVPPSTIQSLEYGLKADPIYIARHRGQYSCVSQGVERIGDLGTAKLKISGEGVEVVWNADPATGRLLRTTIETQASGQTVTDLSDWREVDGIYVSFVRHSITGGAETTLTISDYAVNPVIPADVFQPPAGQLSAGLTFKVLQEQSVPYVVQTNGGISTSCNISGSTSTSMSASTIGNTAFGTATSTPNLRMNCVSSNTSVRWTHVLNAMFVEASDGNAYILACDRAWRWSKCVPLKAGDTFLAERTDRGIRVQSLNSKSKEQEAVYSVLQSKSLH